MPPSQWFMAISVLLLLALSFLCAKWCYDKPVVGGVIPLYPILQRWCPHCHRRKFRSQTSDNIDRWKAEMERVREKRKIRREKSRRERVRRKKIQMREKVGKSRNTVFFQWFVAQEGRKVGSLKRRVRSQLARWEMKNCTPLWREAHFQVKMYKAHQLQTIFTSWDVEKVHAVVARSTFPSQNAKNTPAPDHFWQLRCRKVHTVVARSTFRSQNAQSKPAPDHFWQLRCWKSARRCGAKHISKSKCTKHTMVGALLEVEMSKSAHRCGAKHISKSKCTKQTSSGPLLAVEMLKKCTPLWREAHFEAKMYKTHHGRSTFGSWDVEKVHAVVAQSTFRSQNVQSTRGSDHFWRFRCRFASLHYITLHYTPLHYTTGHYTTLHSSTLHYTTLQYTPLH